MACSEVESIWLANYSTFLGDSAGGRNCFWLSIVLAAICKVKRHFMFADILCCDAVFLLGYLMIYVL